MVQLLLAKLNSRASTAVWEAMLHKWIQLKNSKHLFIVSNVWNEVSSQLVDISRPSLVCMIQPSLRGHPEIY